MSTRYPANQYPTIKPYKCDESKSILKPGTLNFEYRQLIRDILGLDSSKDKDSKPYTILENLELDFEMMGQAWGPNKAPQPDRK